MLPRMICYQQAAVLNDLKGYLCNIGAHAKSNDVLMQLFGFLIRLTD